MTEDKAAMNAGAADLANQFSLEDTPLAATIARNNRDRAALDEIEFPKPAAPRVLTVSNQKGGVGKTTSVVNLAAALAHAGLKVVVIDSDPQGNASTALGIEHRQGTPSVYNVIIESVPLADILQPCPHYENLLVAPSTIDLSGAEIELVAKVSRETRLKRAVDAYVASHEVDYVFIDCPPSLGLITLNAMVAAREILIPIQCEYYALEGLTQLMKNIEMVTEHLNPDVHISTILLTMYDRRLNLSEDVAAEVRNYFPTETLHTVIPRSVRISEAPSFQETVITYDPKSSGAIAYRKAALEIAMKG